MVSILYRPPCSENEPFETSLKSIFSQTRSSNKVVYFNLNLLDHDKNRKVHNFLKLIYQNGMILTIDKPTRVTKFLIETVFKTVIFKSDISHHFPIYLSQILYHKKIQKKIPLYIKENIILSVSNPF